MGFIGYTAYNHIDARIRWSGFLEKAETIPSVIITAEGRKDGKFFIKGLRDPMTSDPMTHLDNFNLDTGDVNSQWTFYHSLLPQYILRRAQRILAPPGSVRLQLKQGVLRPPDAHPPNGKRKPQYWRGP